MGYQSIPKHASIICARLDFEALMSVELRHTDQEYSGGLPYGVIALRLAEQSSDELKSSHPLQFLRAKLAYVRGDMQSAEELAYKAYYIADRGQLDILSLNAAELLVHIARDCDSPDAYEEAFVRLDRRAALPFHDGSLARSVAELIRCELNNSFESCAQTPLWIKEPPACPFDEGRENADIAVTLHISCNTVKNHLKRIFEKLNVMKRFELVEKLRRETPLRPQKETNPHAISRGSISFLFSFNKAQLLFSR